MTTDDDLRVSTTAAPVRTQVLRVLRNAIITGRFKPGERLIERQLCEWTNVSRTSVREALRHLESEGLVTSTPNRGPVVTRVSAEQAKNIYLVRAALEGIAGRLFAANASDAQVEQLGQLVHDLRLVVTGRLTDIAIPELKEQFYDLLFLGGGNNIAAEMFASLNSRIAMLRWTTLSKPGRELEMVLELEEVIEAIRRRDPAGTEEACVRHVNNAAQVALSILGQQTA
jgi:GntR family transcriptional regulator, trigonelline degradation regulator